MIDAFVGELPRHVCVILDEAYVEFSTLQDPDDSLDLLERHPNLVLLRTFSKVYGLCGLRVGYALGAEDFRLALDRVRQPFSVNALAQAAATEALAHQDEVERRVERTAIERLHVESELEQRGLAQTDSQANFSWIDLGDRDEAEIVDGPGRARRDRARRRRPRRAGPVARDLRHAARERPLPRRARRAALACPARGSRPAAAGRHWKHELLQAWLPARRPELAHPPIPPRPRRLPDPRRGARHRAGRTARCRRRLPDRQERHRARGDPRRRRHLPRVLRHRLQRGRARLRRRQGDARRARPPARGRGLRQLQAAGDLRLGARQRGPHARPARAREPWRARHHRGVAGRRRLERDQPAGRAGDRVRGHRPDRRHQALGLAVQAALGRPSDRHGGDRRHRDAAAACSPRSR